MVKAREIPLSYFKRLQKKKLNTIELCINTISHYNMSTIKIYYLKMNESVLRWNLRRLLQKKK